MPVKSLQNAKGKTHFETCNSKAKRRQKTSWFALHICSKFSRNPKKRRDISEKTAMRRWKGWQVFQSWKGTKLFDLWLSELFRKYFHIGGDRWILVREDLEDPGQRKGSSYLKISSTVLPRRCFSCLELFFFFGSTCRFFFKTKAFNFRCASICYIHHINHIHELIWAWCWFISAWTTPRLFIILYLLLSTLNI